MPMNTQMFLFIIFIGVSAVFAVIALSSSNIIIAMIFGILSLFFSIIGFSTKYYTYIYIPALKMKNKTIILNNSETFILSPSGNSIIIRDNNSTYSSAFVKIPLYRSATEMTEQEKLDFGRTFSRIVTLSKNTTKLSSEMFVVNKDEYITKLHLKLDSSAEKLRNAESAKEKPEKITRLKGELTMWENLVSNVSSSHSEALVTYYMVTAIGDNEEEATSVAHQRAEELAAGISAALGIPAYIAEGEELLALIEPNYMIPVETVNELIRQKSIKQGI